MAKPAHKGKMAPATKAPFLASLVVLFLIVAACGGGQDDGDWQLRFDAGVRLYTDGNLSGAERAYSEAIRLNPEFAMSFNNRGLARLLQGQFELAKEDFDEALRLDPSLEMAFNNKGFANLNLGDFSSAITDFDEAIRLNRLEPQTANLASANPLGPREQRLANAYLNRARAFSQLGRFQDAIADLNEAIRQDPEFGGTFTSPTGAFLERARVYMATEQFELALADLDEGIFREPDNASLYMVRAVVFINLGEDEKSELDVQQAVELGTDAVILEQIIEEARRERSTGR